MDEDMYRRDVQMFFALNPIYEEKKNNERAVQMSRLMFGDKK